ncbi:MAG: hypothetical protein ACM3N0_10585 [Chloroflexota bacterium]
MTEILIALMPLLLLLTALLLGHYPGCEAIVRLSAHRCRSPRPRSSRQPRRFSLPRVRAASGGLLIAFGIGRRPPPLLA